MNTDVTIEQTLRPTSELLDELAAASDQLETANPDEIIRWGVERFGSQLSMGTAFGPDRFSSGVTARRGPGIG